MGLVTWIYKSISFQKVVFNLSIIYTQNSHRNVNNREIVTRLENKPAFNIFKFILCKTRI